MSTSDIYTRKHPESGREQQRIVETAAERVQLESDGWRKKDTKEPAAKAEPTKATSK